MSKKKIEAKTPAELKREASKLRDKLLKLRVDRYLKENKNVREIRNTRRQLAKALTAINAAGEEK